MSESEKAVNMVLELLEQDNQEENYVFWDPREWEACCGKPKPGVE